jgi:hypothetical protein
MVPRHVGVELSATLYMQQSAVAGWAETARLLVLPHHLTLHL